MALAANGYRLIKKYIGYIQHYLHYKYIIHIINLFV